MQPHIFIATPCYGGVVTQGYMQSVCALMAAAPGAGVGLTLALLGQDALITRCRNTLTSHFLATPQATHTCSLTLTSRSSRRTCSASWVPRSQSPRVSTR